MKQRTNTKVFRERVTPFPEVSGLPNWTIVPTAKVEGATSKADRRMLVPMSDDDVAQEIQLHEMAHARWSPNADVKRLCKKLGLDPQMVQGAEDVRMSCGIYAVARPEDKKLHQESKLLSKTGLLTRIEAMLPLLPPEEQIKNVVGLWLNVYGTGDQAPVLSLAHKIVHQLCAGNSRMGTILWERIHDQVFARIQQVIDSELKLARKRHLRVPKFRMTLNIARQTNDAVEEIVGLYRPSLKKAKGKPKEDYRPKTLTIEDLLDGVRWGPMKLTEPPLAVTAKLRRKMKMQKRLEEGVVIHQLERLLSDQKVFRFKRRKKGGTVLIDCSGSMGMRPAQLIELVKHAPGVKVAIYGGTSGQGGECRVVANNGKIAKDHFLRRPGNGANVVDGPALQWLSQQKGPLIWVSDGQATDADEHCTTETVAACQRLRKKFGMIQLPSVESALKAFKTGWYD